MTLFAFIIGALAGAIGHALVSKWIAVGKADVAKVEAALEAPATSSTAVPATPVKT